jgi:hypothetical protein
MFNKGMNPGNGGRVSPSDGKGSQAGKWIRWLLFSEGLILLLALAGPGHRNRVGQSGDHALLARLFIEDPGYLEAVAVNFIAANLFVWGALLAAWIVTRLRRKG